jgi:precorrin-2 dehydrogenase/sirohydrochlorin ferrochelatase
MTPPPYPIQLRLTDRPVLVVGAGHVATRKVKRLLESGARLRVIAPAASEDIQGRAARGELLWEARAARAGDCKGAFLVVCATDNAALNAELAAATRASGALALRVDAPDDSDFSVPARAQSAHVDATVSTHGRAPSASKRLGRELRAWITQGPERFVAVVAQARTLLWDHPDADGRLRALSDGPLFEACRSGNEAQITALLDAALLGAP